MVKVSHKDLLRFAQLSGDANPIHVDPDYSQDSMFGEQIVHGIYLTLLAIDNTVRRFGLTDCSLIYLNVKFPKPTLLDIQVEFNIFETSENSYKVKLLQNGLVTSIITFCVIPDYINKEDIAFCERKQHAEPLTDYRYLIGQQIKLPIGFDLVLFKQLFSKQLLKSVPSSQIAEIIATSVFVGMYVPGLNSLFSELSLRWKQRDKLMGLEQLLNFTTESLDERFRRIIINVGNERVGGQITAFERPVPPGEFDAAHMESFIEKDSMKNERAIVLGGSSGIGLGAVKCLLHGGANVLATFRNHPDELESLSTNFRDNLKTLRFELSDVERDAAKLIQFKPTQLYYFITPRIFSPQQERSSLNRLLSLIDTYCIKIIKILRILEPEVEELRVFAPSSSAIFEPTFRQQDYLCAKVIQENLIQHIVDEHKKFRIYAPRLPRYATLQTLSVSSVSTKPVHEIAEHIKVFQDGNWNA